MPYDSEMDPYRLELCTEQVRYCPSQKRKLQGTHFVCWARVVTWKTSIVLGR